MTKLLPSYCQVIVKLLSSYCQVIAMLLPCYCQVIAELLLSYCPVTAQLLQTYCQVIVKLLPSYCQAIGKLLSSYCQWIGNWLTRYCMLFHGFPQVSWFEKSYPQGGWLGVGVVFVKDKDGSEAIKIWFNNLTAVLYIIMLQILYLPLIKSYLVNHNNRIIMLDGS